MPSGTVDGLLCVRTLLHIDDLLAVFREFRRILRSGGLCVVTDIHSDHPYEHTSIPWKNGKIAIKTYKFDVYPDFAQTGRSGWSVAAKGK